MRGRTALAEALGGARRRLAGLSQACSRPASTTGRRDGRDRAFLCRAPSACAVVSRWPGAIAMRVGGGVLLLFERESLAERDGPIADARRQRAAATPACWRPATGDYEAWRAADRRARDRDHPRARVGRRSPLVLLRTTRPATCSRSPTATCGRVSGASQRWRSDAERARAQSGAARPPAAARAAAGVAAEGASSGSAGSRPSTRPRCTSASGRGWRDFEREQLTSALERRTLVQGTSLRSTIHLLDARGLVDVRGGGHDERREEWLRSRRDRPTAARDGRRRPRAPGRCSPRVRSRARRSRRRSGSGRRGSPGSTPGSSLVRVPPSGTWDRRRADLFAAGGATGSARRPRLAQGRGRRRSSCAATCAASARRRRPRSPSGRGSRSRPCGPRWRSSSCAGFGPRTARSSSTSRACRSPMPRPRRRRAFSRSGTRPCSCTRGGRRSCPRSTARRSSPPRRPSPSPPSSSTAGSPGTWRYEKGRIELAPFARLKGADRRAVEAEAKRLAEFHA